MASCAPARRPNWSVRVPCSRSSLLDLVPRLDRGSRSCAFCTTQLHHFFYFAQRSYFPRIPISSQIAWPSTVVRTLDSFTDTLGDGKMSVRHSALLWQAQLVPPVVLAASHGRRAEAANSQGGLLVASGLNLLPNTYGPGQTHGGDRYWPEAAWLLFSVLRGLVAVELPVPEFRFEVLAADPCDGCIPPGAVVWLRPIAAQRTASSSVMSVSEGRRRGTGGEGVEPKEERQETIVV